MPVDKNQTDSQVVVITEQADGKLTVDEKEADIREEITDEGEGTIKLVSNAWIFSKQS